jgi:hypothetical protein
MYLSIGGRSVVNAGSVLREPAATTQEPPPCTATFGVLELPSRHFRIHRTADGRETEVSSPVDRDRV